MNKLYVIIMAGGVGSRLWPMSTQQKPKQFVDLLGTGETLLQATYQRALHLTAPEQIMVVTNKQWVHLVQEQIPGIASSQVVVEPIRKNTGTATLYAINKVANLDMQAELVIMPCDHVITDVIRFVKVIQTGLNYIRKQEVMLTVGIKVSRPEVNYGYIQYLPEQVDDQIYNIKTFTEKPTQEIANAFHRSGDFLWYSGIKVVRVGTLLDLYAEHLPDTAQLFEEVRPHLNDSEEERFIEKIYPQCETLAFRQAIIYKTTERTKVLIGDFGWTDITLWGEVYATHDKDYLGNAVTGAQVVMYDASNCLVEVAGDKLVIISGLEDYIVADSPKGLLICPRDQENEVKNMLFEIKRQVGDKYL